MRCSPVSATTAPRSRSCAPAAWSDMARRTALITGAGRNIGRACALYLAKDGFNVVINGSSNRAACEKVAQECTAEGVEALVAMGDGGEPRDAARIAFEGIARFGAV